MDQIEALNKKLEQKNIEFNEFIYRTSHDVRGPIATIKGLVNVVKMENKSPELHIYFDLIYKVAHRLDLILEHLNDTSGNEDYLYEIRTPDLLNKIIYRLNQLKELYDLDFHIIWNKKPDDNLFFNNETQIFGLIENLLLILTSSKFLNNVKYSVELEFKNSELFVYVIYRNIDVNDINGIINHLVSDEVADPSKVGYNNMRINILRRCLKLTGSSLKVIENGIQPMVRILIPSMEFIKTGE